VFYQNLLILITVLATANVVFRTIEIDWRQILAIPISILFTLGVGLFIIGTYKRFYKYLSLDRKIQPISQTTMCSMIYNSLSFEYYLLIVKQFVLE
jgi:energy-coupling factor transporter transmembrane protein EcfT